MTIPAAILFPDAPSTQFLVGGLPLWVRHIKELRKLEVKEHYLLGIAEVPRSPLNSRLPDDVILHTVSCS